MAKLELSQKQLEEISSASGISLHFITQIITILAETADYSAERVMQVSGKLGCNMSKAQAQAVSLGIIGGADGPTSIF